MDRVARALLLWAAGPTSLVAAWSAIELVDYTTQPNGQEYGFSGGFTLGGKAYLVPGKRTPNAATGRFLRCNQNNPADFEELDLQATDSRLVGFAGGFGCGNHAYLTGGAGLVAKVDVSDFKTVEVWDWKSTTLEYAELGTAWYSNSYGYPTSSEPTW